MAEPSIPKARTRSEYRLTRVQLLKALPKHLFWAALLGFAGGALLYFLKDIHLSGMWDLLMFIPLAAVHVNMAVLPVAIPGRHWSFGYIGAMMLFFLLIAGTVLAGKFEFSHSTLMNGKVGLIGVNVMTYWLLFTGSLLGLLYGLIAGRTGSMVLGLMIGSLAGYGLGIAFASMYPPFVPAQAPTGYFESHPDAMYGYLEFKANWYVAAGLSGAAMVALHAAGLIGAVLGADRE